MQIITSLKRAAVVSAVLSSLLAGSAMAGVVTLTFDGIGTGFQTNTYLAQGVTFSGGIGGAGINVQPYQLPSITYPGEPSNFYAAGNQAIFLNASGPGNTPTTFANFAMDVSNVSMIFSDTEIGSYIGRMIAYDGSGVQIADTGMVVTPNNAYPGFSTLSLNVAGIRKVGFYTDNDGAVADNLKFTVADVPEPASIALFGLALAGLGLRRKQARK